ncbi:MAG: hypothetical protein WBB29_18740 [Geitlerinemataceae cyanobacterium]
MANSPILREQTSQTREMEGDRSYKPTPPGTEGAAEGVYGRSCRIGEK